MSMRKLLLLAVTMASVLAGSVSAEFTVDVGTDMVTWLGQPVALAPNVVDAGDPNLPVSDVTYVWSTDTLPAGVTVEFVPSADVKSPEVIINGPENPEFAEIIVPNGSFEARWDAGEAFNEGQNKYIQGALDKDIWRHYDFIGNGGPVRVWNPSVDQFPDEAPDGTMIFRVYTKQNDPDYPLASRESEAAVQLLEEVFDPSIDYKLTVKVGNPVGMLYSGYAVQLVAGGENYDGATYGLGVAGGTVIAEDYNTLTIAEGTFEEATVLYTAGSASTDLAGLPLQIRLVALEDPMAHYTTSNVGFDDVKLYAKRIKVKLTLTVDDAVTPLETPLEDSLTIDVYADACKALLNNDRASLDITDIDGDCVTEIDDLAEIASNWLDSYALTAAQDK